MYRMILADEGASADVTSYIMTIGMLLLFFVVFWFILIRPQRKREKELRKQLETMRVGDKILTIGGLVGVVANIKDDEITIYTSAANTPVTYQKAAIQSIVPRNAEQAAPVGRPAKKAKAEKEVEETTSDKAEDEE